MNKPQHLAELMLLPWSELKVYQDAVADLVNLRGRLEDIMEPAPQVPMARPPFSPPARASSPSAPGMGESRGLRRSPLRPPKPGSLRAEIHQILEEEGQAMRRSDVIERVASRLGMPVDANLKAKVGEHLRNHHDPFVRKVAQGIYQYVPQLAGGPQ